MKFILFLLIIIFHSIQLISQNPFELLIQSEQDEEVHNILELPDGNILYCGGIGDKEGFNTTETGYIIKISPNGNLLSEKKIILPDSFLNYQKLFLNEDNTIIAFSVSGNKTTGFSNTILYQLFDLNLNLINSKCLSLPTNDVYIYRFKPYKMSNNNFVLTGTTVQKYNDQYYDFDMFFYEISEYGDSIRSNFYLSDELNFNWAESITDKKDSSGYYALVKTYPGSNALGQVVNLNNNLEFISYINIPSNINNVGEIKWFNDSLYIITGIKNDTYYDIGSIILDTMHNIIYFNQFGGESGQINDIPATYNSLVYEEGNEYIYIAGTSNYSIQYGVFGHSDSFIFFIKTNRQLEPVFEKFYKGDAYYYVPFFTKLNDGGFLFLTTRYDYGTQDEERDIFILKVDSSGNLPVSVKEPKIKTHELILYPNPGSEILNIRTAVQRLGGEFTMYDITGKLVFQQKITDRLTEINTQYLPSGTYICNYTHKGKRIESGKWVKM